LFINQNHHLLSARTINEFRVNVSTASDAGFFEAHDIATRCGFKKHGVADTAFGFLEETSGSLGSSSSARFVEISK
jgi:hypothetical protein